ncbi:MAG TPA: M28 family peptidase [Candidatus Polarisedimenticolia bacterium]|nr:M28 family peptidase [Candidatus Polarisedimenticolia bacterium]
MTRRALPVSLVTAGAVCIAILAAAAPVASRLWAKSSTTGDTPSATELAHDFQRGVDTLASDAMEGRGLETQGIRKAADWIEAELRKGGLKPAFGDSYRQPFKVKVGVKLAGNNRLEGMAREAWTPLGFSSPGAFSGELAFVGYGIEAPSIGYREMEGMDLKGKVVLMLRYEPQEKDDASPFDGKKPSRFSGMRYKVLQARERGAAAVIFTTGPLQDEEKDKVPALANDGPESPAGLPVLQVRTSVAQNWLRGAGIDLAKFQKDVDSDLTPRSREKIGVTVSGEIGLTAVYADAWNLGGMMPGRGALAGETVVVGAHYDHLGYGGQGSMRPNEHAIHNGADDNASGTVAAIQIARLLQGELKESQSRRALMVVLFSGEEVGLAGSSQFVQKPPINLAGIAAMINLDMVGRLRDGALVALGAETAPEWRAILEEASTEVPGLKVSSSGDGYGPSDQTSFYASGIPVIHLFTGSHQEYHTPEDDPKTTNSQGAAVVERFAAAVLERVMEAPARLTYVRTSAGPAMAGDSRGYGAYLGTIPDYRAMESASGGVLLSDVRKGGPADLAGIRGSDRIVEMAGTRIENLYDMTYALQDHKPGETVDVAVMRQDRRLVLHATLGDRATLSKEPPSPSPSVASQPATPGAPSAASPAKTDPAAVGAAPAPPERKGVDPYYKERPGKDFAIGAGKPFNKPIARETHFKEIRQLTFGGENAEGYFSPDGKRLIFQATVPGAECDQEYLLDLATGNVKRVSSGKGRTTCGYFDYPEADRIVYATTEGAGPACPPRPDFSKGYVWALYDSFDIVEALPDGTETRRLTTTPGYDAEMTWCPRGGKMVFTSVRDGDLDLYLMDEEGTVRRLTNQTGYDGGAFFSPDCSEIVWRASRPEGEELTEYQSLLSKGLIRPHSLEIYRMKADGTGIHRLTSNGAANFCPTFTADGSRILYASNAGSDDGREFELYLMGRDGGEPEQITFSPGFDGFPHFSPDGSWIVWASNRADPNSHQTNLFIARWVE